MKNKILTTIILVAAVTAGAESVRAQLLIDDFKTGEYNVSLKNDTVVAYQTGIGIIGGTRQTSFGVQPLAGFEEPSSLHIRPNGPLILSAAYRSSWSIYLLYGVNADGQANPLNRNLSSYSKIRLNFHGADLDISDAVQVFDSHGNRASLTKSISAESASGEFYVDYPLDEFVGIPGPIDLEHIDSVFILLQAGTATGANDFALKSIEVVN